MDSGQYDPEKFDRNIDNTIALIQSEELGGCTTIFTAMFFIVVIVLVLKSCGVA